MLFTKIYLVIGGILITILSWANFRGLNIWDVLTPDVSPGRYSRYGTTFHK